MDGVRPRHASVAVQRELEAGAVAAVEVAGELDRAPVGGAGRADDEDRGRTGTGRQVAGIGGVERRGLERRLGADRVDAVALLHDGVERAVGQLVAGELRAHGARHPERLEQERLAVAEPQAAHHPGALASRERERRARHAVDAAAAAHLEHAPARLDALAPHLLREPGEALERVLDPRRRDEGARPGPAVDDAPAHEQLDGLARGHPREAEAVGDHALGREPVVRLEVAGDDPPLQGIGHLAVPGSGVT